MAIPTLYQYFTTGGINAGLSADNNHFTLNERNITIFSGAMHYFRVPQEYWRDRLRKMRAVGLNTVETYVPWNLHEPEPGNFDFGTGGSDFQELLDIEKFLKMAQEEDLFTIVRPGPYICSEWDFGGLPSWLLKDQSIKVRSSDPKFMSPVTSFLTALFAILTSLQFTKGGSIIAMQIENEYGSFPKSNEEPDTAYLEQLRDLFKDRGIAELLFTSDMPSMGKKGMIDGVLYTANFQNNAENELNILQTYQPDKAGMVMEYWSGWFDHWTEQHHTFDITQFMNTYIDILKHPASVNMYMFHGGTNWGFMNGANGNSDNSIYEPDTNSYDYDAPLTENGGYTSKYYALKQVISEYEQIITQITPVPLNTSSIAYGSINIEAQLSLAELLQQVPTHFASPNVVPMEYLPINNGAGQSYGYIVYKKEGLTIPANSRLMIEGRVCDMVMVLINGKLVSNKILTQADMNGFGTWKVENSVLNIEEAYVDATLELVVENMGRINFGNADNFRQYKGLWQGNVLMNNEVISDWIVIPLEFKKAWTNSLTGWRTPDYNDGPNLYKANLIMDSSVRQDSFIDMSNWKKGIVIVNGFVLSRHFRLGPQQVAYLPRPFLRDGDNEILIFEHFEADNIIHFASDIYWETL